MRIDTEFNSAAQVPVDVCVDAAIRAEASGFGCVWKGESNSRDPIVMLSAYAARTDRVEIGTAIYHIFGRSPVTLGIQAATLNEYAKGRLILGLGVANPTIAGWHGDQYEKPLTRIREYIEIVRSVYKGERIEYQGKTLSSTGGFKLAFEPPPYPLRIWMAALGEKAARMAGRIADGVLINMANPSRVEEIARWTREAAEEAGRDPDEIEIVPKLRVALQDDPADARQTLKKVITFYSLQNGYGQMLSEMGLAAEVADIRHAYEVDGFTAARAKVSDAMLDRLPVFADSTLAALPKKLAAYRDAGATRMIVAYVPSGADLANELTNFIDRSKSVAEAMR